MNEYMKPDYEVMVFEANEYVAACPWQVDDILSANCSGSNIFIKLGTHQGNNVWNATPVKEDGTSAGGTEMLYPIYEYDEKTSSSVFTNEYAFCGSIWEGHEGSSVSGEYYPSVNAQGYSVGDAYSHGEICGCLITAQSGTKVGSWHHHLTNVRSKNFS